MANPRYDQYGNRDFEGQDDRQGNRGQSQQGRRGQQDQDQYAAGRGGFSGQDDYRHGDQNNSGGRYSEDRTAHDRYGRAGGYGEEERFSDRSGYGQRPDYGSTGRDGQIYGEGAYSGSRGSMERYGSQGGDFGRRPSGGAFRSEQTAGQFGRDYNGPGGHGYGYAGQNRSDDRGFFQRAGEEIASWFDTEGGNSHRGKGPQGYSRSDQRIEDDVNDRLSDDPMVDASNIRVKVTDGEITLEGEVDSKYAKRMAEDCVDRVSGVKHVQNNLRVRQSSGMSGQSSSFSGQSSTSQSSGLSDTSASDGGLVSGAGGLPDDKKKDV